MQRFAFAFALSGMLPAQDSAAARPWLPNDYSNCAFVNLKAVRDRGIQDELEASLLRVAFAEIDRELGFPLAALDRITTAFLAGESTAGRDVRQVTVFEGNVTLPAEPKSAVGYEQVQVGKHAVLRRDRFRAEFFLRPEPQLQVMGTELALRPILEGAAHGGVPNADVHSLLARPAATLAGFVIDLGAPRLGERVLGQVFAGAEWPAGDRPSFLCVRLNSAGDPDDPHLEVEATIRHLTAGAGLDASGVAVEALLAKFAKAPEFRLLRPALATCATRRDRGDLQVRMDLGRARHAVGALAALLMPLLMPAGVEAVEAAVPVPVPDKLPQEEVRPKQEPPKRP